MILAIGLAAPTVWGVENHPRPSTSRDMRSEVIAARSTLHQVMRTAFRDADPYPTRELVDRFAAHDVALRELASHAVWLYQRLDEAVAELAGLYAFLDGSETDGQGDGD